MKFQKGMSRPEGAGRKKGVPNKAKFQTTASVLAEAGLHPVSEILRILEEDAKKDAKDQMYPSAKIGIYLDLLAFCQAKPKEIEEDVGDDPSEELEGTPTETLLKLVKDHDGAS